jgi:hypothetical protein
MNFFVQWEVPLMGAHRLANITHLCLWLIMGLCLWVALHLSTNLHQIRFDLCDSLLNFKQLVSSIVCQMFLDHRFKYLAPIPFAFVIRTCESNPPKLISKLLLSFPQFFVPPLDVQWVSQNYRLTHIIKWTLNHHSILTLWFSIRQILKNKTEFGGALVQKCYDKF